MKVFLMRRNTFLMSAFINVAPRAGKLPFFRDPLSPRTLTH